MKRTVSIFILISFLCSLISGLTISTYADTTGNVQSVMSGDFTYYVQDDGTAAITVYRCRTSKAVFPTTIDSYEVTRICNDVIAFPDRVSTVDIPKSIKTIEEDAFLGCKNLTTLNYNAEKCNNSKAFQYCYALTTINIGDDVKIISSTAFEDTVNLKEVNFGKNVESIWFYAFRDCRNLLSVSIPNSVETMGTEVFKDCTNLKSVKISNSLLEIPNSAFEECTSLESVDLGKSVTQIDKNALKLPETINVFILFENLFISFSQLIYSELGHTTIDVFPVLFFSSNSKAII